MKKALLIIDVQNDFLPGGSLAVPNGNDIIPVINDIQSCFDLIIATQDWHPLQHKSFAVNNPGTEVFERITLNGLEQVLWPTHCVQGTYGAEFASELLLNKVSAVIRKGTNPETDSYSGFFDNGKQYSTGLSGLLKELLVQEVYVCGLAADYCVYYTAKDAVENGFSTFFIEDASKPISEDNYQEIKQELTAKNVIFMKSSDLKK